MEECNICSINSNQIRLFDAIYNGRMNSICERCSIIENIPIIKIPNPNQLKESERNKVYERMKRLSGLNETEKQETFFKEDKLNELDKNPELELPEKHSLNLINHFHWEVMRRRRRKGLSQKKLAEFLGESEVAIQMIENAKLPENAEILIKKLEQFFQTRLRKKIIEEKPTKEPTLLDEYGQEIEIIPEEAMIFIDNNENEDIQDIPTNVLDQKQKPIELNGDLNIKKVDTNKITIRDLQKLHEKKIKINKKEQIKEEEKIEDRRKILEDLRKKDKLKIEDRRREEILEKQKTAENRQKLIEKNIRRMNIIEKKESEEMDKYFGGVELINQDKKEKEFDSENVKEFDDKLI